MHENDEMCQNVWYAGLPYFICDVVSPFLVYGFKRNAMENHGQGGILDQQILNFETRERPFNGNSFVSTRISFINCMFVCQSKMKWKSERKRKYCNI